MTMTQRIMNIKEHDFINPRLWTAKKAGAYLSIHPETVYELARKGKIRSIKVGKRGIRFDRHHLDEWIEANLAESQSDIYPLGQ